MFGKCFLHTFFLCLLISSNSLVGQNGNNPFDIVPAKKAPLVTPAPKKKVIPETPATIVPAKEEEPKNEVKKEATASKPAIVPKVEEIVPPVQAIEVKEEDEEVIEPVITELPKPKTSFSNNPFDIKAGSRNKNVVPKPKKKKKKPAVTKVKEKPIINPKVPKVDIPDLEQEASVATEEVEKTLEQKSEPLVPEKLEIDNKPISAIKDRIKIKDDEKGIVAQILTDPSDSQWNDRYMLYGILLFIMVALTLIINMNRRFISKIYKAAGNENVAKLSFREYQSGSNLQYYLSYALFIINMSIFVYLLLTSLGGQKNLSNLFLSFAAILTVYIVRHGVLRYMGMIFPLKKEVSFYSFNIFLYNILFGMVLIPINVVLILGPQSINKSMLVTGCLIFFIFFIFRQLRGLSIGRSYLKSNQFHFFTYLCSVEIAPILILIKYLMS